MFIKAINEIEKDIVNSNCEKKLLKGVAVDELAIKELIPDENCEKISLKEVAVDDLLATFDDTKMALKSLFDKYREQLDRFNYGNEFDFLTVLSRTLSEDQKTKMYTQICMDFTGSFEQYI